MVSSVVLYADVEDTRDTKWSVTSKAYHNMIGSRERQKKAEGWRAAVPLVVAAQAQLKLHNKSSATLAEVAAYTACVLDHAPTMWLLESQPKLRKERFRAYTMKQSVMEGLVDEMCEPMGNDKHTLLAVGDAAQSTAGFQRTRGHLKGPTKGLFKRVPRRGKATLVFTSEYNTSKLTPMSRRVRHPQRRDPVWLEPKLCPFRGANDGPCPQQDLPGCKCFCKARGCGKLRAIRAWCVDHAKPPKLTNNALSFQQHDVDGHVLFDRDLSAAVNIGARFIATIKGWSLGWWAKGINVAKACDDTAKSWAQIFEEKGWAVPFKFISDREKRARALAGDL
jgi:hypothetical protein